MSTPLDSVRTAATVRLQRVLQLMGAPGEDATQMDQADRLLAALALVAGAVVIGWPQNKPAPRAVLIAGEMGRRVWARRSWWLPAAPDHP